MLSRIVGFRLTRRDLRQLDTLVERHQRVAQDAAGRVSRSSVIVRLIQAAHAAPERQRPIDSTTEPSDEPLDVFMGAYLAAAATGTPARLYLVPVSDTSSVRAVGRRRVDSSVLITAEGTSVPGEVPLDEVTATCTATLLGRSMRLYLVPSAPHR